MERFVVGSKWDRNNRNGINNNFETLFGHKHIKDLEKQVQDAIDRVNDLGSIPTIMSNAGSSYPLINHRLGGTDYVISDKVKNTVLDVHISNAEPGKVYQLAGIYNGLGGVYGVLVYSYNAPTSTNIVSTTKKVEIAYTDAYNLISDKDSNLDIWVAKASAASGISISITVDRTKIGSNLNVAENDLASSHGAIITPTNYTYKGAGGGSTEVQNAFDDTKMVYVDKGSTEIKVYIPTTLGYVGYTLIRKTIPYNGESNSNVDLWCVGRIARYQREAGTRNFTEDGQVILYGPNPTAETIFRHEGDTDYSGGFYHGDEKIQSYKFYAGNADVTNVSSGQYRGTNIVLMQETLIYRDSYTAKNDNTEAFLRVKKYHMFDAVNGWTLKTRTETLKDVTLNFSSIGGFAFYRKLEDDSSASWTDMIDLSNMKFVKINEPSEGVHGRGEGANQFKVIGWHKDFMISYESDSPDFDTFYRTWAASETKLYSQVHEEGKVIPRGTVTNSKVTYNLTMN